MKTNGKATKIHEIELVLRIAVEILRSSPEVFHDLERLLNAHIDRVEDPTIEIQIGKAIK
jgi:hypothetical protein